MDSLTYSFISGFLLFLILANITIFILAFFMYSISGGNADRSRKAKMFMLYPIITVIVLAVGLIGLSKISVSNINSSQSVGAVKGVAKSADIVELILVSINWMALAIGLLAFIIFVFAVYQSIRSHIAKLKDQARVAKAKRAFLCLVLWVIATIFSFVTIATRSAGFIVQG